MVVVTHADRPASHFSSEGWGARVAVEGVLVGEILVEHDRGCRWGRAAVVIGPPLGGDVVGPLMRAGTPAARHLGRARGAIRLIAATTDSFCRAVMENHASFPAIVVAILPV